MQPGSRVKVFSPMARPPCQGPCLPLCPFMSPLVGWCVRLSGGLVSFFIRAVRRCGRWFPERGCILEHPIFRFAEMILRDRCSTSYDLASLFRGRRGSLDRWTEKHGETHWYEAVSSALNSCHCFVFDVFYFEKWGVSQNCFVSDVVKFKNWGCLAELLRFLRCQLQTLRKSRRIVAFLMLSSSKPEDVSQNSFVCKLADRQVDR